MNWSLIACVTVGVTIGSLLPQLIFFHSVSSVLVALAAFVAFDVSTLMSLVLRIHRRRNISSIHTSGPSAPTAAAR